MELIKVSHRDMGWIPKPQSANAFDNANYPFPTPMTTKKFSFSKANRSSIIGPLNPHENRFSYNPRPPTVPVFASNNPGSKSEILESPRMDPYDVTHYK